MSDTSRDTGKQTSSDDVTVASIESVQAANRDRKSTATSAGIKRSRSIKICNRTRNNQSRFAGDKAQVFTKLPMRGWCASTAQFVRAGKCGMMIEEGPRVTLTDSGRAWTATH